MVNHKNRGKQVLPVEVFTDLDKMTGRQLADYAKFLFLVGYRAGSLKKQPLTSHEIMRIYFRGGWAGTRLHREKFRTIYGAGHEMGLMFARRLADCDWAEKLPPEYQAAIAREVTAPEVNPLL
jgi:hypothetical protein